jgi:hypothetical protein
LIPEKQVQLYLENSESLGGYTPGTLNAWDVTWAANVDSHIGTWNLPGQPTLTAASSHPDPFVDGLTNAAFTVTVINTGTARQRGPSTSHTT